MKRHKELVLEIATALRDADDTWLPLGKIEAAIGDDSMPPRAAAYHVELMRDAGLVSVENVRIRLTWAGHDYIDENAPRQGLKITKEALEAFKK